jgi:MFS family permease
MFSLLGGRFGRKLALNAAFWTYLLGLLVLLNPSAGFSSLIAGLFLMGGVMCASSNFVFLMINEIFSERWRERSCAALMVIWSLSEMVIAPLINLLDGWENYYFWVLLLPSIATAFSLIFILDSPLFFLEQGSTHRAF